MRRRAEDDGGSIVPFTVALAAALVACAGLAVDGGRILAARREAASLAAAAARRGSQEISWDALVAGRSAIDPTRAEAAAGTVLARAGAEGELVASADSIAVTVRRRQSTVVLGAFGIGPTTVTATRAARPLAGG